MIRRWWHNYLARKMKQLEARRRENLLREFGVLLTCLWCRQIGNVQDEADLTPFREDGVDDGRYILTCGCCGGRSLWDFGLAPVPLSLAATQAPLPIKPQVDVTRNNT